MRQWLITIRKKAGRSQYDVAKEAGISQSYYSAIETGYKKRPLAVPIAKKIASALAFEWTRFYADD